MSLLLITILAAFALIVAMGSLLWWRQYRLAQKRADKAVRPCGCASTCTDHLYQISEPSPK